MSKKATKQSRRTARRKARQERAMAGFREKYAASLSKWQASQEFRGLGVRDRRAFLFTMGVPLQNLPQRAKQRIVEDFG